MALRRTILAIAASTSLFLTELSGFAGYEVTK
jgi:hypothetical protein